MAVKTMKGEPSENKCPTCGRKGRWFAGKFAPFCSKRCRLVDLGKWLNEEYQIEEPLRAEHLDAYADLPPGQDLDRIE